MKEASSFRGKQVDNFGMHEYLMGVQVLRQLRRHGRRTQQHVKNLHGG